MVSGSSARFSALGLAGTCVSTTAALGCCASSVLGPAAGVLTALVSWLPSSIDYEVLYASVGLTVVGLTVNAIRRRRVAALSLGVVGTVALLAALHDAWDMGAFRALVWSGALALALAAIADVRATVRWTGRERRAPCAT